MLLTIYLFDWFNMLLIYVVLHFIPLREMFCKLTYKLVPV